jgi:hypothetical protein
LADMTPLQILTDDDVATTNWYSSSACNRLYHLMMTRAHNILYLSLTVLTLWCCRPSAMVSSDSWLIPNLCCNTLYWDTVCLPYSTWSIYNVFIINFPSWQQNLMLVCAAWGDPFPHLTPTVHCTLLLCYLV